MLLKLKQYLLLSFLIVTVTTTSGCFALLLGAAAGAGAAVYVKGDLEKNVEADIKKAHNAVLAGLKKNGIFVISDTLNVHDATTLGEYDDGTKVNVQVKSLTEKSSKIKVRVGVIGDEAKSVEIMNAIERKL
jgi:hypothetical protein